MTKRVSITLTAFRCTCAKCGNAFVAHDFPDFQYGMRVLRTQDGSEMALLACTEDPLVDEVGRIVDSVASAIGIPRAKWLDVFNRVLGRTCDRVDGKLLDASKGFVCPRCCSEDVESFEFNPGRQSGLELSVVSHMNWDNMSEEEKRSLIREAVTDIAGEYRSD